MPQIHPTAIIDPSVKLADDARVLAYAVIKGDVTIGHGTIIREHCVIEGSAIIGDGCAIGPAAYVGLDPQHGKFKADPQRPTYVLVGTNTVIREGVTLHRAFHPGLDHATTIGDGCFLMAQCHVAHDCRLCANVTLANGVLLGGHCEIGTNVFMGGGSVLHQFCRIGRLAVIAGNEAISRDIPPFAAVRYGGLKGYNAVGCRRSGLSRAQISAIRSAYQQLHSHRTMNAAVGAIKSESPDIDVVREMLDFIAATKRGIQPSVKGRAGGLDDSED